MTQYTKKRRKSSLGRIDIEGTHTLTELGNDVGRNGKKQREKKWEKRQNSLEKEGKKGGERERELPKGEKRGLCAARKVRKFQSQKMREIVWKK